MSSNFEFIKDGTKHVFSGKEPRDAALKVATRYGKKGKMKETVELRKLGSRNKDGSYSLHQFRIGYDIKPAPSNAPNWIGKKMKMPKAEKIGVKRVKEIPKA